MSLFFINLEPDVNNCNLYEVKTILHSRIKVEISRPYNVLIQCKWCRGLTIQPNTLRCLSNMWNVVKLITFGNVLSLEMFLQSAYTVKDNIRLIIRDVLHTKKWLNLHQPLNHEANQSGPTGYRQEEPLQRKLPVNLSNLQYQILISTFLQWNYILVNSSNLQCHLLVKLFSLCQKKY